MTTRGEIKFPVSGGPKNFNSGLALRQATLGGNTLWSKKPTP